MDSSLEDRLVHKIGSSGTDLLRMLENIRFPFAENTIDKTKSYVGIGEGKSTAVPWMLGQGANAYAIDVLYKDINELDKAMQGCLTMAVKRAKKAKLSKEQVAHDIALVERSFRDAFTQWPSHFIAARASALPIATNSIDFVYSSDAITSGIDRFNTELFFLALNEALRIVRPGGELHLQPVYWGPQVQELHDSVINGLQNAGYRTTLYSMTGKKTSLQVRKPTFLREWKPVY
jgi:hypothetical protein